MRESVACIDYQPVFGIISIYVLYTYNSVDGFFQKRLKTIDSSILHL